jgi:hypothetical protein
MYGHLAELETSANNWRAVKTTIEGGLKLVKDGSDPYSAPYLYRLLGAFHARPEGLDLVEADRALRTSIDIASAQGARSERLLSALALARLPNQSSDSLSESRNILIAAFEGFETETDFPAVAEAQSLLADLNALPEVQAARERERKIAEIRSNYRRAVAWDAGQWSDRAAAAFESAEKDNLPAEEKGAAYYSEVFILMAQHWGVGNMRAALALGESAYQQRQQLKERGKVRWAYSLGRMIGANHIFLGECQSGYATLKEVANYFDANPDADDEPLGIMDDQAASSSYLTLAAWQVGAVREALASERNAFSRASRLGHLGTIVNHRLYRVLLRTRLGDRKALRLEAERFLEVADQSGIPYFLPAARMFHTYAVGQLSEPGTAAAELRAQLVEYIGGGARIFAPELHGSIAELEMLTHDWRKVGKTIEDGLSLVEAGCDPHCAPYLYRLLGVFHARRNTPDLAKAAHALKTSIDIATAQGARSERLLSALALARLPNQSLDSLSEARNILLSAFEGFENETEFLAVAEAQSLLAELEIAVATAP